MPSIFTYFDLQEFLRADFTERKSKNPGFSIRAMASKLGLNSSTLTRIFSGKRNLSKNLLPIFIKFLGLRTKEAEYFTHLAGFCQAKSERVRMAEYGALATLRNGRTKEVSEDRYAFYEQWYFTAIRELLRIFPFNGDYGALSRMFEPPITVPEAKRAVNLLLRLGFIDKVGTSYAVRDASITTGETWQGMAVERFHQDTLAKAVEALEHIPREERDFSTMTMCYSAQGYKKARETLMHAREELTRIEECDNAANRVYQINLQLFPLTISYQQGAPQ
jgi:uncharacterized protein (TIGR02147 family)